MTSKITEDQRKKVEIEMENRIEQEINRTLGCMAGSIDIQVTPLFAENLSSRIAGIRVCRGVVYRSRAFYPVAILVMLLLNLTFFMANVGGQNSVSGRAYDQTSVIASEYGIGQSGYTSF